jgi:hypothetical protein
VKKMEWGMVIDEKAGLGLETAGNVKCGTTCGGAKSWLTLGGGGGSGQLKAAGFAADITRQITRGG